MKISKLFHWLYATLMFLPFIFLLPSLAYYGFNEHASAQERTEQEPVYYDTNEVNNIGDLIIGNVYHWTDNSTYVFDSYSRLCNLSYVSILNKDNTENYLLYGNSNRSALTISYTEISSGLTRYTNIDNVDCYLVISSFREEYALLSNIITHFTESDINIIKDYEDVTYSMSISDSMYQAWQSTWDLPLFSWTHNSFVAEPFTYITGLFGMSADNLFNYVVTYFVSISVCWLVFDFLMYVPNLAHRWLDKGALD